MNKLFFGLTLIAVFLIAGIFMISSDKSTSSDSELATLSVILGESYAEPLSEIIEQLSQKAQDCKAPVQTCGTQQNPIGTQMCRSSNSGATHECSCGCYASGWVCSECTKGCNPNSGKCYPKPSPASVVIK